MKYLILFASLIALNFACAKQKPNDGATRPEQMHLSLGAEASQMIVTWVTMSPTIRSICKYGLNKENMNLETIGDIEIFIDGGKKKRKIYNHRAILTGLKPETNYHYRCGSESNDAQTMSQVFSFKTINEGNNWSPKLAVYGDLGVENPRSLDALKYDVAKGRYDVMFHVGDIAYDMDSKNGRVGDEFMNMIEPIAANVAYQVLPGNHESAYNFSNFDARFSMVSSGSANNEISNHFWSYNLGSAHIIAFSTEFYHFEEYGSHMMKNQYEWLERDLSEANKQENRVKRPWIIVMGHRPLYWQNGHDKKLIEGHKILKAERSFGLEELFYKYGVDVMMFGHKHHYERHWPHYNDHVHAQKKHDQNVYHNPKAPVHFITGSAGNFEKHHALDTPPKDFVAYSSIDYGYTKLDIINSTSIHLQQISVDKHGGIIDEVHISKDQYKPAWIK